MVQMGCVVLATAILHTALDLELLDWMLPGMSGVECSRRLRAEKRTQGIPVIISAARAAEQAGTVGLDSGADAYVTKPFSPRQLAARGEAVLHGRSPRIERD